MSSVRRTAPRLLIPPVTEGDPAATAERSGAHTGEGAVDLTQT